MKTTLVAHLAVVGMLFGSAGAELVAQTAHDGDAAEAPRPRLKLPRARSAPTAPAVPRAPMAHPGTTPKLGVMIEITDDGLVIAEVLEHSLAEAAGVQAGDMLLKMDGRSIDSVDDIRESLAETRPGSTLGLTVVREGKGLVKLEAEVPRPAPPEAPQTPGAPAPDGQQGGFLGVQLGESDGGGVTVDGVVEQSAAWFAGLDKGDVLLKIGKTEISSGQDVVGAVASHPPGTFLKLTYERDGEEQTARVRLGSRAPTPGSLGSFFAPRTPGAGPGNLRFGVPGSAPHALPNVRFFDSQDGDVPFAIQSPGGDAQVFSFDGDGGFWVSDGDDEDHHGTFMGIHPDHGDAFMLDLGDLHGLQGLGALGDGTSLNITIEDGVLTIDRDGDVKVIDLDELEGLEELHELGDGDIHGMQLETLEVLPKMLLERFHGADGDARVELRVKRLGDGDDTSVQQEIRRLNFAPDAHATTITTTTVTGGDADCSVVITGDDAGCCADTQETGDVN